MSDSTDAGGGPLVRTIAGQEVTFAELTFYDRRDLLREYRKQQRDELKKLLDEHSIPAEQKYAELRAFDQEIVGAKVWAEFFNSDDGMIKIMERSLERGKPGNGSLISRLALDTNDITNICAYVTHTPLIPLDGRGGERPNAQSPATMPGYGQD